MAWVHSLDESAYSAARPVHSLIDSRKAQRVAVLASRVRAVVVFVALDVLVVLAAYGLAEVIYLRDRAPAIYWRHFVSFVAIAIAIQITANYAFGLYGRMWRHAGIEEVRQILLASVASLAVLLALYPLGSQKAIGFERVPISVIVVGSLILTAGLGVLRFHSRLFAWQRGARRVGLRVAVIGSRDAGATVVRDMLRNPKAGLVPVAVFDDDVKAHGLSLLGVPVVGGIDDIPVAAPRYRIQQLLLAIPSPPSSLVERALTAAETAGVTMKILPGVKELAGIARTVPTTSRTREPRIEDLLGQRSVDIDHEAVHDALHGRRVLVTGAGGSIGSEITRQVAGFDPELLVLLDHDETHLHDTAELLAHRCELSLTDICDREALFEAFARYQPEVVFHAAAHKHVPILESHPLEAATTNVFGTANVVEAAKTEGAGRFVFISTDKVVCPTSVMGASKWVAEQAMLSRAPSGLPYCVVRFGNVLGSRGSVIPTFARQIAMGGPVTVTDPRMTRFFMSVEEAVQLVLQSSVLARGGGEVFMLEMGEPVRILDLAKRMIRLSGYSPGTDIAIEFTGVRPGEKLDEELYTLQDDLLTTAHPAIWRIVPPSLSGDQLFEGLIDLELAVAKRDSDSARNILFTLSALAREEISV
jgi:FlaA1/EpsC-like NDP-sugar epimerase